MNYSCEKDIPNEQLHCICGVWAHSSVDFDSLQPYKYTVHRAKCLSNAKLPYPKLGTNYWVSNWGALHSGIFACTCM